MKRIISISDMKVLAKNRGGQCLSSEYINNHSKLEWECSLKHIWKAEPRAIKRGQWCPICSSGLGERICRLVFETLFEKKFIKARPKWLVSPLSKKSLELDGFCEELNIAFEYNGQQHYTDSPIYKSPTINDQNKIELCRLNNVRLFIIPQPQYIPTIGYVKNVIKIQADKFGIIINNDVIIDIGAAYSSTTDLEELKKIKDKAIAMGGICLSDTYLGCRTSLTFQCGKCNHIWEAKPADINSGSWCHKCAGKCVLLNDVIKWAKDKNGKLLSKNYPNGYSKLEWECHLGHKWFAPFNQIKRGTWCPKCYDLNRKRK